jgi:hypothetical protein
MARESLLKRTVRVYAASPLRWLGLALLVIVPVEAIALWLSDVTDTIWPYAILPQAAVFTYQGLIAPGVARLEDDRARGLSAFPSLKQLWRLGLAGSAFGLMTLLPALAIDLSIALGFLVLLGSVILSVWVALWPAALALEPLGLTAALRRNFEVTAGAAWKVFGVILLWVFLAAIAGAIAQSLVDGGDAAEVAAFLAPWLLITPAGVIALNCLYVDRRPTGRVSFAAVPQAK